ncbi:MAG: magnesium/cobalt transporter CorA [Planctomycetia bacterium]|nr:magnesium/cobalt transporter CorA [Planctomycetia bacterium]
MTRPRHRRHRKTRFSRRTKPGDLPGLVRPDPAAPPPVVHVIAYGPDDFIERRVTDCHQVSELVGKAAVTWVNVEGLGNAETIHTIGNLFHLHPLALEDVVNTHQRPKAEQYHGFLFIVARMAELHERCSMEQVSLFLGRNFVVTFLEDPGDAFETVRQHLRQKQGRIRAAGAGYLAYALLDAVVDAYFPIVEEFGERLDSLEDEVVADPDRSTIAKAHRVKRELRTLRRAIWPLREAINSLSRDEHELIDDETRVYLRDCYDHTVQIIDIVETYRELDADLTDLYLSSLSNRLNEVMKVLTIIATIFMPMSFIASVYGMNFNTASPFNMPELNWPFGYLFALALMVVSTLGMLVYFRWKGWVGPHSLERRARAARAAALATDEEEEQTPVHRTAAHDAHGHEPPPPVAHLRSTDQ